MVMVKVGGGWPQQQVKGSCSVKAMENEKLLLLLSYFHYLWVFLEYAFHCVFNFFFFFSFAFSLLFQLQLPFAINVTTLTGQLTGDSVDQLLLIAVFHCDTYFRVLYKWCVMILCDSSTALYADINLSLHK